MEQKFIMIPLEWVRHTLILVAGGGVILGVLSWIMPERSIGLYQFMMKCFNWRVEPMNPQREIRNTRWLGFLMIILSLLIVFFLFRFFLVQ